MTDAYFRSQRDSRWFATNALKWYSCMDKEEHRERKRKNNNRAHQSRFVPIKQLCIYEMSILFCVSICLVSHFTHIYRRVRDFYASKSITRSSRSLWMFCRLFYISSYCAENLCFFYHLQKHALYVGSNINLDVLVKSCEMTPFLMPFLISNYKSIFISFRPRCRLTLLILMKILPFASSRKWCCSSFSSLFSSH